MTHSPVELGAMIEGIKRWVETESPTSNKAAVDRMIDVGQLQLRGPSVVVPEDNQGVRP